MMRMGWLRVVGIAALLTLWQAMPTAAALVFYCQRTSSADTYSGSTTTKIVDGTATADVTQGDATVDLSDATPDLSGVNQGATHDTIRIADRTDGINGTDIFEIIAVETGGQYTVEVSPTPTAAGSSDKDWCIGGPWGTLQRAMDLVSTGDYVWVKADGDYGADDDSDNICAEIQRASGLAAPITFEGYKITPGDTDTFWAAHPELYPSDAAWDPYRATIDGTANSIQRGLAVAAALDGTAVYYIFKHIRIRDCSIYGASLRTPANGKRICARNCRVDHNQNGVTAIGGSWTHCSVDNNTMFGMESMDDATILGCDVWDNGEEGIRPNATHFAIVGCRIFANGKNAIETKANSACGVIMNNTIEGTGSSKNGIAIAPGTGGVIANNIICNFTGPTCSGTYLPGAGATTMGDYLTVRNNLYVNNTVNRTDFPEGLGDVEADDAGFMNAANHDYRLRFGSPARGAGYPSWLDIGACQRKERTGGPFVRPFR